MPKDDERDEIPLSPRGRLRRGLVNVYQIGVRS